jgi:hypothetical protein
MTLKESGIDLGLAVAGLFGSVLCSSKQAGANLSRTIASLVGGAASANYVTPLLLKFAHLEGEPQFGFAAAFLLGFCGLRGVEILSDRLLPSNEPKSTNTRKRTRK